MSSLLLKYPTIYHDDISVNGTCNEEEDEDGDLYDDIEIGVRRTGRRLTSMLVQLTLQLL